MNKFLPFVFFCAATAGAWAQDAADPVTFKVDGITYRVNDNAASVSVQSVSVGDVDKLVLPAEVTDAATTTTYSVTGILEEALYGLKSSSVTIPASMNAISEKAFFNSWVKVIEVAAGNTAYTAENGILYNSDKTTLCCFPPEKEFGGYVLPETVTRIGGYAFCGVWLTAFEIPSTVTSIGEGAFMGTKLKKITIPATVTEIGGAAFQNCQSLTSITFPEGMTLMPDHILATSWMLSSVNFPSTLTEIGAYAFNQTFAYGFVTEVVIPDEVTYIGVGAFQGDRGLKKLTLGKKVAKIDLYAFAQCAGLGEITVLNPEVPECVAFGDNTDEVTYAFADVPDNCVLYVPAESVAAYTEKWGMKFKDIRPIETGGINDAEAASGAFDLSVSGGVLRVSADSVVEVYSVSGIKVAESANGSLEVSLPAGVYVVRSASEAKSVRL